MRGSAGIMCPLQKTGECCMSEQAVKGWVWQINDGFYQHMVIFKNCKSKNSYTGTPVIDYWILIQPGYNYWVWQYKMCNDGAGECNGHITSVHQPFKSPCALFYYVFITPIPPQSHCLRWRFDGAHLQLDQVDLKVTTGGIYSINSVLLQDAWMKLKSLICSVSCDVI